MAVVSRTLTAVLAMCFWLAILVLSMRAQQAPAGATGPQQQSASAGSLGVKNPATQTALDDTLLEETDGEDVVTHLESHVDFEYRYDTLYGGENSNQFNITSQQVFGPKHPFAGAIELPSQI